MQRPKQVSILRELFRQLDNNVNVDAGAQYRNPTDVYTDRELARREWRRLFQDHPQLIGLSMDLPVAGSYFTVDDFGVPVLATRDSRGRLRAFVNACRHRGARVAPASGGEAKRFTCPFHAWTYSNEGELLRIPRAEDFGPLDTVCNGLVELPSAESQGLLWVHPNPEGELDTGELSGALSCELAGWRLEAMSRQRESSIDMHLNWKLANDTFGETCHFSRLHRDSTFSTTVHDRSQQVLQISCVLRWGVAVTSNDAEISETILHNQSRAPHHLGGNLRVLLDQHRAGQVEQRHGAASPGLGHLLLTPAQR